MQGLAELLRCCVLKKGSFQFKDGRTCVETSHDMGGASFQPTWLGACLRAEALHTEPRCKTSTVLQRGEQRGEQLDREAKLVA